MFIGISGPAGAGKDTAAEYLAKKLDALHVSGGDILREHIRNMGLEPKKSAMSDFGTFLRTHYGSDIILSMVLDKAGDSASIINSGFRSVAEAHLIHDRGGLILYIDAPDELRYSRIADRNRADDKFSIQNQRKLDLQERSSHNPLGENLESIKQMADDIVLNDKDLNHFYAELDNIVAKYKN